MTYRVTIQLEDDGYEYEVPLKLFLKLLKVKLTEEQILQVIKESVRRV